ncbi:FIST signal transduction protein [Tepidimonas charontis]|uniref:FIST C domain protein n=1 Tax=Tepidimonas charontis TaxID=2267262 RepID=A0A554XGW1_9BURK|nr:FIST C-terminal domain-containing protein [Tepidimonas charontis]TSE35066.1 FIST C domain protein [Tepidimonas charontis]
MLVHVFESSDLDALRAAVVRMRATPEVRSLLILLAEGTGWPAAALDTWARAQSMPLIGGIFPRVLAQRRLLAQGGVVVGLPWQITVHRIPLGEQPQVPSTLADAASLLVLADGLSAHVQPLIDALYDTVGVEVTSVGGGCGSLSLRQSPCVLTARGLDTDVAAVAALPVPLMLGVRHGWRPLDPGLVLEATGASGNVVHTLNWEPALAVYRRVVEPVAGVTITADNFFDVAKAFPLGLLRADGEFIVRDPIRVEGDALVCVGAVRPHATLTILNGSPTTLLQAAQDLGQLQAPGASGRWIFDCISRVLFLGEEDGFTAELQRLVPDALPTAGALTLGEVAGTPNQRIAFCNKTATVALLP